MIIDKQQESRKGSRVEGVYALARSNDWQSDWWHHREQCEVDRDLLYRIRRKVDEAVQKQNDRYLLGPG